jgi:L-fuculose-phosphate aldolase
MNHKEELVRICHKVYKKEFVSAYDGNLSVRIDSDKFLITPSGKCKGDVRVDDLIVIDDKGNKLEGKGKASTEYKIHLIVYNNRPDIKSVIHCHPPYTTAFAALGESLNNPVFPEVILSLGKIPLCKYATPSLDELPKSMEPFVEYSWAFILENHGAVTIGKNIEGAYFRMEKLEHAAKTLAIARSIGREKSIPLQKLRELYSIAESTYGINIDKRNRLDY